MSPTIAQGEQVIVRRTGDVTTGDIIAFRAPYDERVEHISRIVAAGGDTVQIRDKRLFINGKEINEPYVVHEDPEIYPRKLELPEPYRSRDHFGPFVIPANHFFTLGDNRDHSYDGRYWGAVPAKNVIGRVILIYSARGFRRPPASSRTAPTLPPK
jgi:signal peptidase I